MTRRPMAARTGYPHAYSREQILIGLAVLVTILIITAIAIWRNRG